MTTSENLRHHLLFASAAKQVFSHAKHGMVFVEDPITLADASSWGLQPLIMLGLTVADLPITFVRFYRYDEQVDLGAFLNDAWGPNAGLKGLPDQLTISRNLAQDLPDLPGMLSMMGVLVNVADKSSKKLSSNLRAAQHSARELGHFDRILSVAELNKIARKRHDYAARSEGEGAKRIIFDCWHQMQPDYIKQDLGPISLPKSTWLTSWDVTIKDDRDRELVLNGRSVWLLTTAFNDPRIQCDTENDTRAELVRNLLPIWPNPVSEIAASAGITVAEVKGIASGKLNPDSYEASRLFDVLNINVDPDYGHYRLAPNGVVIARHQKSLNDSWIDFAHGGDGDSFEVVPDIGTADPSWRYFVTMVCYAGGFYVTMVERGDPIINKISDIMILTSSVVEVPTQFYQELVRSAAKASQSTASNYAVMTQFSKHYHDAIMALPPEGSYFHHRNLDPAAGLRSVMPSPMYGRTS